MDLKYFLYITWFILFLQKKGLKIIFSFFNHLFILLSKLEDSMQQLDLFDKNNAETYLYGELEKLRNSTDRRCRAIFSLLTELQSQVIKMQDKDEKSM